MAVLGKLELVQDISHSISEVWRALTEPALLEKWWATNNIKPEVGHEFTIDKGVWGRNHCEVLAVETERLISYSFSDFTKVTWLLSPEGDGTKLRLIHDGFELDSVAEKRAYEEMVRGWPCIMARIAGVVSAMSECTIMAGLAT